MFLISTKELAPAGAPGGRAQEFVVLGATGNGAHVGGVCDLQALRAPCMPPWMLCSPPDHQPNGDCTLTHSVLIGVA